MAKIEELKSGDKIRLSADDCCMFIKDFEGVVDKVDLEPWPAEITFTTGVVIGYSRGDIDRLA